MKSTLTIDQVEALIGEAADLHQRANIAALELNTLREVMEAEITEVRLKWQEPLNAKAGVVAEAREQIEQKIEIVRQWAFANKKKRFTKQRSITFLRGTIGFRLSPPALAFLPKFNAESVIEAMRKIPNMARYLRIKREVDKAAIVRDQEKLRAKNLLANVGLCVLQSDVFYFEPKRESAEAGV